MGPAFQKEKLKTFFGSLFWQQYFIKSILNCSGCSLGYFHFYSYALLLKGGDCRQLGQVSEGTAGVI